MTWLQLTWPLTVSCHLKKVVVSCIPPTWGLVSSGGPTTLQLWGPMFHGFVWVLRSRRIVTICLNCASSNFPTYLFTYKTSNALFTLFTLVEADTHFTIPQRVEGWVDLDGCCADADRGMLVEFASPEFDEFLDLIGRRVQLKGFEHYRGGLDVKSMSTASYLNLCKFNLTKPCGTTGPGTAAAIPNFYLPPKIQQKPFLTATILPYA